MVLRFDEFSVDAFRGDALVFIGPRRSAKLLGGSSIFVRCFGSYTQRPTKSVSYPSDAEQTPKDFLSNLRRMGVRAMVPMVHELEELCGWSRALDRLLGYELDANRKYDRCPEQRSYAYRGITCP
jgi:hypothetical protein